MPRVRIKVPLDVEIPDDAIAIAEGAADVVRRVRESGAAGALASLIKTTREAAKKRRRRPSR